MSRKSNPLYEHWYNFVLSDRDLLRFSKLVNHCKLEDDEISTRPYANPNFNGNRSLHVIDIAFASEAQETPWPIDDLLDEFDGIDVYRFVKEERLKIKKQ